MAGTAVPTRSREVTQAKFSVHGCDLCKFSLLNWTNVLPTCYVLVFLSVLSIYFLML